MCHILIIYSPPSLPFSLHFHSTTRWRRKKKYVETKIIFLPYTKLKHHISDWGHFFANLLMGKSKFPKFGDDSHRIRAWDKIIEIRSAAQTKDCHGKFHAQICVKFNWKSLSNRKGSNCIATPTFCRNKFEWYSRKLNRKKLKDFRKYAYHFTQKKNLTKLWNKVDLGSQTLFQFGFSLFFTDSWLNTWKVITGDPN